MRCEITDKGMEFFPANETEAYAFGQWRAAGASLFGIADSEPLAAETSVAPIVKAEKVEAEKPKSKRELIIDRLHALGIDEFKPQTRTSTLKTMLENAEGGNGQDKAAVDAMKSENGKAATVEDVDDLFAEDEPEAVEEPKAEVEPTKEDVAAALKALATAKGVEAAKAMLGKAGAKNVSALDPKHYKAIIAAAKKKMG